ncbi:MAG: methylated-DNA--[protein]-cysteine S-methyltransferase [Candidatus Aminicenantes bacterium]|nr:methylated-DNA--[protein]-cysteine S-methyltransferase [Candidatus Aminicenantes bacterium]
MSETRVTYYESPIGLLEVRGGEQGVSAVTFVDAFPRSARGARTGRGGKGPLPAPLAECLTQIDEYFRGRRRTFSIKLDLVGTDFQNKVWRALRAVRFGKMASYRDIARNVGNAAATRAVGGANHRNPVSIIVPCHRVVGSDGRLTGYGGGLWRKEWLLRHEGNDLSSSRRPDRGKG